CNPIAILLSDKIQRPGEVVTTKGVPLSPGVHAQEIHDCLAASQGIVGVLLELLGALREDGPKEPCEGLQRCARRSKTILTAWPRIYGATATASASRSAT